MSQTLLNKMPIQRLSANIDKDQLDDVLNKALSATVNTSLVLALTLGTLVFLTAPGQPLAFLAQGACAG